MDTSIWSEVSFASQVRLPSPHSHVTLCQVPSLPAFAGFYLLSHTINKPLEVIHTPVPHFNEKMLVSVERTLRRFQPDQPFERSGWMIADDRNMFWRKYLLLLSLSHVSYE